MDADGNFKSGDTIDELLGRREETDTAQDLRGSDTDLLADLSLLLDEDMTDKSDSDAVGGQLPGMLLACHFFSFIF